MSEFDGSALRNTGVTMAEAAERLQAAMQHCDLDAFEALIATQRPDLWKRMNRRPTRLSRALRTITRK